MKTVTKTAMAFAGMLCLLALAGCPKKAVVAPERPAPPPEPVVEDQAGKFKWNLGTIHFDFDRSDIRTGDASMLQGNYGQIKAGARLGLEPDITIEGYCDPVGTSEYNIALGMRRAEAAKAYLVKLGADAGQLSTISYGEERLVTQNERQYEQNRRCEFKVVK